MPRPVLAAYAALVVLLAGCAVQVQGSPTAGGEPPAASTDEHAEGSRSGSSETPSGGGLAGLQPCDLVDAAGLASLGLTGGEEKTLGGARVCRWRHDGETLDDGFTVSVELFDGAGLEELAQVTTVEQLPKVGAHDAVSFVDPTGGCGVSLGVGDASRVDNTAVGGDRQQGCRFAARLAELVEPNLP